MRIIKVKNIQPTFDKVVTTFNVYTEDCMVDGTVVPKGTFMLEQVVISAGPNSPYKEGQMVHINPIMYGHRKHQKGSLKDGVITDNPVVEYELPVMQLADKQVLLLDSRDIDYIITDYEEVEAEKPKKNAIILTQPKNIIV